MSHVTLSVPLIYLQKNTNRDVAQHYFNDLCGLVVNEQTAAQLESGDAVIWKVPDKKILVGNYER